MPTPREWVRICELEKAAVEHQSVEKWIEIDRRLDPNWTEEKSKALYQRKEEWLKDCAERLNEARANLSAATWISGLSSKRERELPVVLKAVLHKMMDKWQLCGGAERRCVECRRKEVGSERPSRPRWSP